MKTIYSSIDERTRDIFENINEFKIYTRKTTGTGDEYKKVIAEKNFITSEIIDASKVILNNSVFNTPYLHIIDEIFTQFFNMNPPFITRYKSDISKYYKLTLLNKIEYVYGSRWTEFLQLDNIIKILSKRPDSKRAIIAIYAPYDTSESRTDVPCTLLYNFLIRDSKLHMYVAFRSHDLYAGYRTDYILSSFVLHYITKMLNLLNLNIETGSIIFYESSLHYYPNLIKNSTEKILNSFTNENKIFKPFVNTPYSSPQDIINEMNTLRLSEEASYAMNFDRADTLINEIQDKYLKDMAIYLRELNYKKSLNSIYK
jgi:thymidylate synthase